MAFLKKATLDIKSVYATDQNGKFKWLDFVKQAAENPSEDRSKFLPTDAYKFDTNHFVYILARSISGGERWGHNGNYDYFPWEEIKKALPTYPGCGFFIEHKEDDAEKDARGIVLDAIPNEEEQYAICLCAIDREQFPEFCQQLLDGIYNQVSMSCLANECECSLCGNVAHSFDELCQHQNPNMPITYLKGKKDDKGNDVYEINRDLCFTGLSAVAVPADKDAFVFDIKAAKKKENKLQAELVKYQNIKQAGKMKEFKMACEEQFKALDTVALLNKLQNCASAITNQVVDQQNDVNILNTPLQGILRQLMELQIGLTVLDLNKLTQPKEDSTEDVMKPVLEQVEVPEVTNEIINDAKADNGHILTNNELEEVNFDKEINSYNMKSIKSSDRVIDIIQRNDGIDWKYLDRFFLYTPKNKSKYIGVELKDKDGKIRNGVISVKYQEPKDDNSTVFYNFDIYGLDNDICQDKIYYSTAIRSLKDDFDDYAKRNGLNIIKTTYYKDSEQQEANFDKEIESYDNWSYTPFSSTANRKQAGAYFLKDHKQLQQFIDDHGEDIRDIRITKDGTGYRVFFENEYGRFHDDVYLEKYSSLDKIIEKTY